MINWLVILIILASSYTSVVTKHEYEQSGGIYVEPKEPFQHSARIFEELTFLCSALIIGPQVILTAAHCLHSYSKLPQSGNLSRLSIVAGMSNENIVAAEVQEIRFLSEYFPREKQPALGDIAILRSKSNLYSGTIKPILWPSKDHFAQTFDPNYNPEYLLYSWGAVTSDGKTFPDRVKKIKMHRVTHCKDTVDYCEECDLVNPQDEDMVCSSVERSRGFVCTGDSGGPLIHYHRKKMTLVGIFIGGTAEEQSCGRDTYAINAHVNIFHWKDEIITLVKEFHGDIQVEKGYNILDPTKSRSRSRMNLYGLVYLMIGTVMFTILLAILVVLWAAFRQIRSYGKFIFRKLLGFGMVRRKRQESFHT